MACSFDGSVPTTGAQSPDGAATPARDAATFDAGSSADGMLAVTDKDGDQIVDDVDNCPDVANADQFNEDGDALGNLCDNCPAEDNQDQANADLDELGDLCDPQPGQANQMLYFEGFDQLPDASDWNGLGSWQVNSGSLVQDDNGQRYYLRYEGVDGADKVRVVSKMQFSNPLGTNGIAFRYGGAFVEANADPDNNGCWLLRSLSQSIEGYARVAVSNGSPVSNTQSANLVDNSDYVIASSVNGGTRSCSFQHGGDSAVSFDYSGSNFNGTGVGIVTSYTEVRVAYFYAVRLQ